MYRAATIVVIVAVLAMMAAPAMAQTSQTARTEAMGRSMSATPNDETAHLTNPAGLPHLDTFGVGLSPWPVRGSATLTVASPAGIDYSFGAFAAGKDAAGAVGWGASVQHTEFDNGDATQWAVGWGGAIDDSGLSAGASLQHLDAADDATMMNLGLMYRAHLPLHSWSVGLMANDIFDDRDAGVLMDLGGSMQFEDGATAAITIFDITGEVDTVVGIGGEMPIPMSDWIARAGVFDGDFNIGAGYRWTNFEAGLTWQDVGDDDIVLITGTGNF